MILISTDGVEPSTLKGTDFKSAAYTNSAKQIIKKKEHEWIRTTNLLNVNQKFFQLK